MDMVLRIFQITNELALNWLGDDGFEFFSSNCHWFVNTTDKQKFDFRSNSNSINITIGFGEEIY